MGGHAGTKLGPFISPLQKVANRAYVLKRDQFWDQFRGGWFWSQDFSGARAFVVSAIFWCQSLSGVAPTHTDEHE